MTQVEILDTPAAAKFVGLSYSTLTKLRLTGGGPRFLKLGRSVRYRTTDLAEWLADKARMSTSDNGRAAA